MDNFDLLQDTKKKIQQVYEIAEIDDDFILFKHALSICDNHNARTEFYPNVPKIADISVYDGFTHAMVSVITGPDHIEKIRIDLRRSSSE